MVPFYAVCFLKVNCSQWFTMGLWIWAKLPHCASCPPRRCWFGVNQPAESAKSKPYSQSSKWQFSAWHLHKLTGWMIETWYPCHFVVLASLNIAFTLSYPAVSPLLRSLMLPRKTLSPFRNHGPSSIPPIKLASSKRAICYAPYHSEERAFAPLTWSAKTGTWVKLQTLWNKNCNVWTQFVAAWKPKSHPR